MYYELVSTLYARINISNYFCIFSPAVLDLDSNFPSIHSSRTFPSTHYKRVHARRVTCIMYVYGWSKLLACDNTQVVILNTLHTWHPGNVGLCTLITQLQVQYTTETHCSISVKWKTTYVSAINYSLSQYAFDIFWSYFDTTFFWVNMSHQNSKIYNWWYFCDES